MMTKEELYAKRKLIKENSFNYHKVKTGIVTKGERHCAVCGQKLSKLDLKFGKKFYSSAIHYHYDIDGTFSGNLCARAPECWRHYQFKHREEVDKHGAD